MKLKIFLHFGNLWSSCFFFNIAFSKTMIQMVESVDLGSTFSIYENPGEK